MLQLISINITTYVYVVAQIYTNKHAIMYLKQKAQTDSKKMELTFLPLVIAPLIIIYLRLKTILINQHKFKLTNRNLHRNINVGKHSKCNPNKRNNIH